jgi:DNA repair protein RecO (recombination protein O)
MSPNSTHTEQAFVLHTRAFSNTSLIIEVLTEHAGRLGLLAKGARTPKSAFYGVLQPFIPLYLYFGGKGELPTLYKAEATPPTYDLQSEQLFHGLYLNELLMRLLHRHDPHPGVFALYRTTLGALEDQSMPDVCLRYFEIQLLEELGYGLNFCIDCNSGAPISATNNYYYVVEQGPMQHLPAGQTAIRVDGATLLALHARELSLPEQRQQAKLLMRSVMDHYLGQTPLKTRELYRQFRS